MKLRRLLFHIHLYTGLVAGALVSLTGITGSLLVFNHELDGLLFPELHHSAPPGASARPLPPQGVLDAVRRERPEARVQSLVPGKEAGDAIEVRLKGDRKLYLDQYTGRLLGERAATDHPLGFLFLLHTKLLSGENGEVLVGAGGLLLLLLGTTGVILWWPGKRGVRQGLTIQWGASWKRVNFDLHRVGGALSVALLALIAMTGAAMVWSPQVTDWTYRVTGTPLRPKVSSKVVPGRSPLSLDELAIRAETALPGAVTTRITPASKPAATVVFRKKLPRELHPNGTSFVYLDQYSGAVLLVENALQARPAVRLLNLRYPLHIGQFGGWPVRVLYALIGLMPSMLFVTGCVMWLNRVWVPRRRRAIRQSAGALATARCEAE